MHARFGIIASIVVSIFVVFDCISLALSVAAAARDGAPDEIKLAMICNVVTVGASFIALLLACICSCSKQHDNDDDDDNKNCCITTSFVSLFVAGSISVVGTFIAGTTQVFAAYIYEDVSSDSKLSSLIRAAAAMNFIAALFGTFLVIATMCTCLRKKENWLCCKECPLYVIFSMFTNTALVITILITGFLTMFMTFYTVSYSSEHGDSPNYDKATTATCFSFGAAVCLLLGFCCIGGPILCRTPCANGSDAREITGAVMFVLGVLVVGTVVSGGLMMKVGQSFASEETLNPDEHLNRGPISAKGYFIGALNFVVLFIAILFFIMGIFFCSCKRSEVVELQGEIAEL